MQVKATATREGPNGVRVTGRTFLFPLAIASLASPRDVDHVWAARPRASASRLAAASATIMKW